jgi:outer membrane receptor protein involved in Fe transport
MQPVQIPRNGGSWDVSGVDLQLEWRYPLGPGELGLNWYVGYMYEWLYTDPGAKEEEWAGTIGGCVGCATPEWKWLLTLRYLIGGAVFEGKWRYVDSIRDALEKQYELPSYDYFDLGASYAFEDGTLQGLALHAGVENLTDESPPLFPTSVQANTDPSQYDVLGRRYYVSLSYEF